MNNTEGNRDLVIFDLDGTLALIDHRRHFVEGDGDKDWERFDAGCVGDPPNWPVIVINQLLSASGYRILILSGRSRRVEAETRLWLARYGVRFDELRLREVGDETPDDELKARWLAALTAERILVVFEDRQRAVEMWRSKDVTCFQVAPGNF